MKLLLTSGGIRNNSQVRALEKLLTKDVRSSKAVYILTAANVERGDKAWLISNLNELSQLFRELDLADLALPRRLWEPQVIGADVIVVGGGNTTYLMRHMKMSGFEDMLPDLLKTKVYVGISAGSMVAAPTTAPNSDMQKKMTALGLVSFGIQPHYRSAAFPLAQTKEQVERRKLDNNITYPLYALDDQSAVSVDNHEIQIVSEGHWDLLS